jgi:isoleucyl-tRNA synthetase
MINLNEREEKVLGYWKEHDIYKKIKDRNMGKKKFYFLDGPPNAYGLATHHLWVYTIKDAITKYRRFSGYHVHDRGGFDVHGLPIENKIERSLNLASKDDIEKKVGIAAFVKACKDYVDKEMPESVELLKRFGVTMDLETYYVPYRSQYISKGWGIFKTMYDKGLLYKDLKPMAYCPRCGTVLSAQGPEVEYKDESDNSIFVRYKIKSSPKAKLPSNTYLVIWTTTPWTLPANMSIAVNPNVEYVVVGINGTNYVVAKGRLAPFMQAVGKGNVVNDKIMGSELEGTTYSSPLEHKVAIQKKFSKYHKVILGEQFVTVTDGTGLLHVAPGHGPEDYILAKKNKIAVFSPIDKEGRYTEEAGDYKGLMVPKEANEVVISDLKASGDLLHSGSITHTYPHCWRCHSKLIYRATEQWFVKISRIKKKMLSQNEKIEWHPDFGQKWFADAVESSPDWCISRQRFWGAPIPIWVCAGCKEIEVMGSVKELVERAGLAHEPKDMDLHKPHIDGISFSCRKCGGTMKRVPDTIDVWYESGIAHTASLTDEEFAELYPADCITESLDQIRGWFATLLRTGVIAHGKTPFKRVLMGGMMKDEFGEEMHRSHGNAVSPQDLMGISSVDGWRLFCASKPRYMDLKLRKDELKEANNHVIMLYNIAELAKELSMLSGLDTKHVRRPSTTRLHSEDRWILSRLNTLIMTVNEKMDSYNIDEAVVSMRDFMVEDFSRFYIKLAKQRVSEASKAELKRLANLIGYILKNFIILMSIVTPFTSEHIYIDMFQEKDSVLLDDWPRSAKHMVDKELESDMAIVKESITALLNSREKAGLSLRWPVASATLEVTDDRSFSTLERLSLIVENSVNAKKLLLKRVGGVREEIKPLFARLGPDFKEKASAVSEAMKEVNAEELKSSVARQGYYELHTIKGTVLLKPEHFTIVQAVEKGEAVLFRYGKAFVDKEISTELKEETMLREVIRRIQMMRKDTKLTKLDHIAVEINASEGMLDIMKRHEKELGKLVKAKNIMLSRQSRNTPGFNYKDWDVLGDMFNIGIKKL